MNSKVVSESPKSFPSWMSFKLVTDWLTNWADDCAFNLRRFGGLGLKFWGSFDFFCPGESGSSMPPRFYADCNPLCRLIAASDSFPSIDMFVESFCLASEWSLSSDPPCPGKLISELIPSPPNRLCPPLLSNSNRRARMSQIKVALPSIIFAFFSLSTRIPNFYSYWVNTVIYVTFSSLQMMLQFCYLDVLVMLSFMLPRLGSKEKGLREIFIYS